MAKITVKQHELNGLVSEMIAESAEFKRLAVRVHAAAKSEAAKHADTQAYMRSIRLEYTKKRMRSSKTSRMRRNKQVYDFWVYSDDPGAMSIEYGAVTMTRNGKTWQAIRKPQRVMNKALRRVAS